MHMEDWVEGNHRPFAWQADGTPDNPVALGALLVTGRQQTLRVSPVEYAWYDYMKTASEDEAHERLQALWRAVSGRHVSEHVDTVLADLPLEPRVRVTAIRLAAMDGAIIKGRTNRRALVVAKLARQIHFEGVRSTADFYGTPLRGDDDLRSEYEGLDTTTDEYDEAVEAYVEHVGQEAFDRVSDIVARREPEELPDATEKTREEPSS